MTPHAISTLAVRFLGLVVAIVSLPPSVRVAHDVFQAFCMGYGWGYISPFIQYNADEEAVSRAGWPVLLAFGLYLVLSGRWVIARLVRGLDGTCPRCGYDITATQADRCPECGAAIRDSRPAPR